MAKVNINTTVKELLDYLSSIENCVNDENARQSQFSELLGDRPEPILISGPDEENPSDISVEPELLEIDKEGIESQMKDKGIEAIAFYAPYHFFGDRYWGIYYYADATAYFCEELFGKVNTNTLKRAITIIREHELFHFTIEVMFTMLELIFRTPIYEPLWYDQKAKELEEALATAVKFNKSSGQLKSKLNKLLSTLPNGYKNYSNYISEQDFKQGLTDLIFPVLRSKLIRQNLDRVFQELKELTDPSTKDKLFQNILEFFNNFISLHPSPIYAIFFTHYPYLLPREDVPERLLIKHGDKWIVSGPRFPVYNGCKVDVYVGDHEPPHIHIFIPPDEEKGSYYYPSLQPYRKDKNVPPPPLSNSDKKKLRNYFKKYGNKIVEKLKQAYPNHSEAHKLPEI
jgi:hypothetical protein